MSPLPLNDLPQVCIEAMDVGPDQVSLRGRFSQVVGVRLGPGWLYRPFGDCLDVDLTQLGADRRALLVTPAVGWPQDVVVGMVFPYYSGYWQPRFIDMVLEGPSRWARVLFPEVDKVPCEISGPPDFIGPRHQPHGYKHVTELGPPLTSGGIWVCERCFNRYVCNRDLGFLLGQ